MKTNIIFFEDAKDLESLTGLSYDELWDKGFDLDDMDWGFVSDENYITETEDGNHQAVITGGNLKVKINIYSSQTELKMITKS